jgi:hypothetical protein
MYCSTLSAAAPYTLTSKKFGFLERRPGQWRRMLQGPISQAFSDIGP